MDATMRSYMHQVFEAVMELAPQSPSAIPGTKKEFENTMDAFIQYSNFLSTVTSHSWNLWIGQRASMGRTRGTQDPDEVKNCTFSLVLHQHVDSIF